MTTELFDRLQSTFKSAGAEAAVAELCRQLRDLKDYNALFYALLMKKRLELGVSPIPTGSNQDLPPEAHAGFEDGIRDAARQVGQLFLNDGNIPGAWAYYRMIGEPAPVESAIDKVQLGDGEDSQAVIEIAFQHGVHPRKGFDWILERYGICSAITTLGGGELPFGTEVRDYCIKKLIRALHGELVARLQAEIKHQQGFEPTGKTVAELIAGRDWLFGEDVYHIDISHLSSVVQMSINLPPCPELELARDLCAYGKKLSPRFALQADPPFEKQYHDWDVYLRILSGVDVDADLAHFRDKADNADPHEIGTYPAEVYINLLLRLGRNDEALAAGRKYLVNARDGQLSCPNLVELCQKTNAYKELAEIAREQNSPVNFLAALIGQTQR